MVEKAVSPLNKTYWQCALAEVYCPVKLIIAANFIAIRVVLKVFSIPIFITSNLYISLEFLFNALGALIYGPILAIFTGAGIDVLSYIVLPKGPYYFPFTVLSMLSSLIFALFLYKAQITTLRLFISKFLINIFINVIGNYFALYFLYGNLANFDFYLRLAKNLLLLPLEVLCISIFLKAVLPMVKRVKNN